MQKLNEMHKFVFDTMKINPDGYLGRGDFKGKKRLKTDDMVKHLISERRDDLAVTEEKDLAKFSANLSAELDVQKFSSKDVLPYGETVKLIDDLEQQLSDLTKLKEQYQADKKAHLAILSAKALKVVDVAFHTYQLEALQRHMSEGSSDGSPREQDDAGGADEGSSKASGGGAKTAGGLAQLGRFMFGSSEPANKKAKANDA